MPERKPPRSRKNSVFLNIPYDAPFEQLYVAYIAGLACFGLVPRLTLEIPGSERRLDRIVKTIQDCRYSVHDLSRVELDKGTPRFNMPFELGLAVALNRGRREQHDWYVFETVKFRAQRSLSDINGTEVYVHDGTPEGVLRELSNAFVNRRQQPTVPQMLVVHRALLTNLPAIMKNAGSADCYTAQVFRQLYVAATAELAKLLRK